MASIARKNLFEDIPRFIVAQAGIMFAVSLVTIQVGILDGFSRSTTRLIDQSDADIWVGSKDLLHIEVNLPIPLDILIQARKVEGVAQAEALINRATLFLDPSGTIAPARVYGFNPNSTLFAGRWKLKEGSLDQLNQPYTFISDRSNLSALGLEKVGQSGSVGPLPAKLVGLSEDTQSMASASYLYTSLETANAFGTAGLSSSVKCSVKSGTMDCVSSFSPNAETLASPPPLKRLNLADPITFVLVKAKSGQDLQQLKQRLEANLSGVSTFTKAEMADITRTYWQRRTGVGFILGLGATVGVIVGMVVVSQILYSSVSDHLKEFGTLKAMGASDWLIYRVITEQALWMAILGYIPSMLICLSLGSWTVAAKGIMILITPGTAIAVLGLTVVMCVGSALFAIQKVTHVDPAIVFKA
jgi:putative ABC transport system permease protein